MIARPSESVLVVEIQVIIRIRDRLALIRWEWL